MSIPDPAAGPADASDHARDAARFPPRFRWLKRLTALGLVVVLLLVGLRLAWGYRANARYAALIAEIEASGDPIHFHDLVIDPVPDANNKAYHLQQAMAAWPTVPGQGVLITDTDWYMQQGEPGAPPDPITDNAAYLQQLQPVLAHLRRMDAATDCDWGVRPVSPVISFWNPSLGNVRRHTRLIQDAVQRAHILQDTQAAAEWLELTQGIARTIHNDYPSLIGHLVLVSIHSLVYGTAENIIPTLSIPTDPTHPARRQAESLLARLSDDQVLRDSRTHAWIGERWVVHDFLQALAKGQTGVNGLIQGVVQQPNYKHDLFLFFFKPIVVNDTSYLLRYLTANVEASRSTDSLPAYMTAVEAYLGTEWHEHLDAQKLLRPLSAALLPGFEIAGVHFTQVTATRRMAATALAIRLYETDHGRRPETLDQLVPDYLPAVPRDPFTLDEPIKYLPEGAKLIEEQHVHDGKVTGPRLPETGPAILYCVGRNETDHGGLVVIDADGRLDFNERYREGDQWFLLDPEPEPYTLP